MATQVPIPKLGQSEETVSIVKWHKTEGDIVAKGDVLFEVETDKAVLEVESQFAGTLLKIILPEGKEVPVMSIAAVIGEPGEDIPEIKQPEQETAKTADLPKAEKKEMTSRREAPPAAEQTPQPKPQATGPAEPPPTITPPEDTATPVRHRASPRARNTAAKYLVDIKQIPGSGPGGRIVERDIHSYLDTIQYEQIKITPAARNLARENALPVTKLEAGGHTGRITIDDVRRAIAEQPEPMSRIRRIIAERLQYAKQNIPHFYVTVEVDVTDLMTYRKYLKEEGFHLSLNDFVIKAAAMALLDFPRVNSVTDDGVNTRWRSHVNIGMAVNLDNGLVVPVLHDADKMKLDELHDAARGLAGKAREQKLTPEEMQGGTFTVSNMGMMNVENFSAIINPGESAILAISSAQPVAKAMSDRTVAVRDIMKITLSADHRVIDGVLAANFINRVKKRLQDLSLWQTETGIAWTAQG